MEYQSSIQTVVNQTGQIIIGANFLVWGQLLTESESYFCSTEPKAQMSISHHMSINFSHLDLENHRAKLDQTWVWCTLDGPLEVFKNYVRWPCSTSNMAYMVSIGWIIGNLGKFSLKLLVGMKPNLVQIVPSKIVTVDLFNDYGWLSTNEVSCIFWHPI